MEITVTITQGNTEIVKCKGENLDEVFKEVKLKHFVHSLTKVINIAKDLTKRGKE